MDQQEVALRAMIQAVKQGIKVTRDNTATNGELAAAYEARRDALRGLPFDMLSEYEEALRADAASVQRLADVIREGIESR